MTYTYEEVLDRINNARRFGKIPGAEATRRMLEQTGHPEKGIPFVHVAGTNGKGSVCAFLSSVLKEAGKKVGTFTSPHLIDFRERIAVNGRMIPEDEVCRIGNMLLWEEFGVEPAMFDYCLVMALIYFKEQNCDIMVIETGLGGRLDSTNAIGVPEAAVITRIGLDHTAILGGTVEEIAAEKAGIIKTGCPLVVQRQTSEAYRVIKDRYLQANQNVPEAEENFFAVSDGEIALAKQLNLRMNGVHQLENAASALLASRILLARESEKNDVDGVIRRGLERAFWQGRMEILLENPFFMVDGAHNADGARALADSLAAMYPGEKFHLIMGVMADKDYESMVKIMLPLAIDFTTFTPEDGRALKGRELAARVRAYGVRAEEKSRLDDVIGSLCTDAKNVAFGSLYFIGSVKSHIRL